MGQGRRGKAARREKQRVGPWWRTDFNGQYVMSIKFGSKPVEFEKGKAGIAAPNKEKLLSVIDTLIAAVRAGELDDLLGQAAKMRDRPENEEGGLTVERLTGGV